MTVLLKYLSCDDKFNPFDKFNPLKSFEFLKLFTFVHNRNWILNTGLSRSKKVYLTSLLWYAELPYLAEISVTPFLTNNLNFFANLFIRVLRKLRI
jgi:hypothetical protein